ncbi:MAG: GAF domain-containing protein [Anaerolineales bacterium]|nr:GAF domain-containing protein [Anaerolineales bacterium]MCZ2122357.1 GAF domain-containing protein [Anaerolineales bacterium]
MQNDTGIETQLKDALQLSNASWAVVAERVGGAWILRVVCRLNKVNQNRLIDHLSKTFVDAWLCGSLSGGNMRSANLAKELKLGAERFYAFPLSGTSRALLVGADNLSNDGQRLWKLTASLLADRNSLETQPFIPDLQSGLAFNLPLAIEKVLSVFVQSVQSQGVWVAIRRGDSLDILAEWNDPQAKGKSLQIDANPILRRLNRSLAHVTILQGQPNWDNLPHGALKPGTNFWICVPLAIGQRLIGVVALWRQKEMNAGEVGQLNELAARIAPSIEVVVTFSEMTAHLHRLGLLNDFVLTVSSAQNLDQIAKRMFGLLSRSFNTELIALFLRSSDGRVVRDYRLVEGRVNVVSISLEGHSIQPFLREGRLRRVIDSASDTVALFHKDARSSLIVPLRYRGATIGMLVVESLLVEAFSQYDEHLMVVIASHLAGLIEYTRLREEAEGRARGLSLIHEVVQQVIGSTNKREVAQITADLVAQYFKYDLATILLVDDAQKFSIQGIGGAHAGQVKRGLAGAEFIQKDGITGQVARTGKSILVNDTAQEKLYEPIKGWEAGSEVCVAVKEGESILGIIDVENREQNAFTHNDLIAMESLAGILASVVSSANQYQKLQELVRQLRATEVELNARMEAQRSAENRLIQAAKLAAVGEMAAGVAHELNNPLTTVTGFSELVLEDLPVESDHREEMEMVLKEARRASDVVRRLLDFSRQGEPVRARASLNDVVKDVIALTRHLIHTNEVHLHVMIDDALPWIFMDHNQMKQVLLNLIHNALQAMPSGGELSVQTASVRRGERDWAVLSVKDSGVGISLADQNRIFEPFFTKGEHGGTGLGLSVTYGIVTDHGGTIEVTSERNNGSTFAVYLPI